MGIDNLQREFAGRVCFMCPVDMQTTLITAPRKRLKQGRSLVEAGETGRRLLPVWTKSTVTPPQQRIAWMEAAFLKLAEGMR